MKRTDMKAGVVYAYAWRRGNTTLGELRPVVLLSLDLWRQTQVLGGTYRREIAPAGSRPGSGYNWSIGYPVVLPPVPEGEWPETITVPDITMEDFATPRRHPTSWFDVVHPRNLLGRWDVTIPEMKAEERARLAQAAADQAERNRQRAERDAHVEWLTSLGVTGYIATAPRSNGVVLTPDQLTQLQVAFRQR